MPGAAGALPPPDDPCWGPAKFDTMSTVGGSISLQCCYSCRVLQVGSAMCVSPDKCDDVLTDFFEVIHDFGVGESDDSISQGDERSVAPPVVGEVLRSGVMRPAVDLHHQFPSDNEVDDADTVDGQLRSELDAISNQPQPEQSLCPRSRRRRSHAHHGRPGSARAMGNELDLIARKEAQVEERVGEHHCRVPRADEHTREQGTAGSVDTPVHSDCTPTR